MESHLPHCLWNGGCGYVREWLSWWLIIKHFQFATQEPRASKLELLHPSSPNKTRTFCPTYWSIGAIRWRDGPYDRCIFQLAVLDGIFPPKTASSVPEQMVDPPPAREAAMVALRCSKLQFSEVVRSEHIWLVVSTHLKNISQNGNLPQVGVKIKNIWNHHLDIQGFGVRCWGKLTEFP